MSNTFSAVENQIKIFKEMQDEIAKDTSILSDEEYVSARESTLNRY